MKTLQNGQYRICKKGLCECIIGQDTNSRQPHLIKCKEPAKYIWFSRTWFVEVLRESNKPIYGHGALCCEKCFEKLKEQKEPINLEEFKELHRKNKEK